MKTLDDLRTLMAARGLERLVEHAEKLASPSIRIVLGPKNWVSVNEHNLKSSPGYSDAYPFGIAVYPLDETPIGTSKVGGLPDLPPDFEWPERDKVALPFLAQIRLEEVSPFDKESRLPSGGMLYFFYDESQVALCYAAKAEACRVVYFDGDLSTLSRCLFPDNIKRHEGIGDIVAYQPYADLPYIHPLPMQFCRELNLADAGAWEFYSLVEELQLSEQEQESWWQITMEWSRENEVSAHRELQNRELHEIENPYHQMFGFPYCGNYDGRDTYGVEGEPQEWMLLLQLSPGEGPLAWGVDAATSFFVRRADLKAKNFSNVYVTCDR